MKFKGHLDLVWFTGQCISVLHGFSFLVDQLNTRHETKQPKSSQALVC